MKIYNMTPVMPTIFSPICNPKNMAHVSKNNPDSLSISKCAINASREQSNSIIDSLLKQKQNIIDSKKKLIERTVENGQSLESIKDQLKDYEDKLNTIDQQIAEYQLKEQQKTLGMDKKNNVADNKPQTEEEIQTDRLNNVVAISTEMTQVEEVSSVKAKMQGQAKVLEIEIKLDEGRSHSGQRADYKREQLGKISERITNLDQKIGLALKDTAKNLKSQTNYEKEIIPEKPEATLTQPPSQITEYKDTSKSSNNSGGNPQLEILA